MYFNFALYMWEKILWRWKGNREQGAKGPIEGNDNGGATMHTPTELLGMELVVGAEIMNEQQAKPAQFCFG